MGLESECVGAGERGAGAGYPLPHEAGAPASTLQPWGQEAHLKPFGVVGSFNCSAFWPFKKTLGAS